MTKSEQTWAAELFEALSNARSALEVIQNCPATKERPLYAAQITNTIQWLTAEQKMLSASIAVAPWTNNSQDSTEQAQGSSGSQTLTRKSLKVQTTNDF